MLRYCFYLLSLYASLQVQASPLMGRDPAPQDRIGLAEGLVSFDFTLINSNELIPQLQLQQWKQNLDQEEFDMLLMQLLQVNMMKLLLIMDISIMLCLFYACIKRYNNITESVRL